MNSRLASIIATAGVSLLPGFDALAQEPVCAGYELAILSPEATLEALAMDGDVLVAGWPRFATTQQNAGTAIVYQFQAGNGWTEVQQLLPTDGAPGEWFGSSVAVDGDVIVIGERSDSCDEAAFVFRFDGSTWVEEQKLTPSVASFCNRFGSSVAVSGDTILVGAERDHHSILGTDAGTVFAYRFDGSQWMEEAILFPAVHQADARFGNAIAMKGDLALIGAPGRDGLPNSNFDPGAVFAFRLGAGGVWTEETEDCSQQWSRG
ncbi:MAG: hypothetical protein ACI8X5_002064 [Planctomycetota bacterium]|jgi:hypothetical protein